MSVISRAENLIQTVGKEEAIKAFEKEIEELGEPKNFEELCILSGKQTAIQYIKGEL